MIAREVIAANPIAAIFLAVVAVVAVLWLWSWLRGEITVECCDHSECERPQVGDVTVSIFESKRQDAGDGVEAGV